MNYRIIPGLPRSRRTVSYLVRGKPGWRRWSIPGGDAERIKAVVAEAGVTLMQILLTHGHLDHVGAAAELAQHYGVPVIGPEKEDEFWLEGLPAQSRMFGRRIANRCVRIAGSMKAMWSMWGMWRCRCCTARAIRRAMWSFDDASRLLISGDVIFGVGRAAIFRAATMGS